MKTLLEIFKKDEGKSAVQTVSQDNLEKIRTGLLESYQHRLRSKLAARFPINLELKYSTEGTTTKADIYDNKTIRSTKIKAELIHLFDKHRGRLLIIGEPGAGKTTLLLQLAYQLLYRQDPVITDIPIIINMATWRERFSSVEEWLKELLPQMGFSKGLVEQLLTENRLLPLFDGLDELGEDLRKPCLEAIAEFGKARLAQYVICSRIVEYSETVDAPVYCQIMVKPLTITQIREGLQEVNSPETNGILDAIKKDLLLREAIKTPFYLNTVQLLFASSKAWEEFEFKTDTLEGRQQEIVEFFVADATSGFEKYSSDQVKKYLGFLADRMTWKGLVEFELVDLQYDWDTFSPKILRKAKLIEGLVIGLSISRILGLFFSPLIFLAFSSELGLFLALIIWLITVLSYSYLLGIILTLLKNRIKLETKDGTNISISKIWRGLENWWPIILTSWLAVSFVGSNKFGLIVSLFIGLVAGVLISFILSFIFSVLTQIESSRRFLKITHPYQRFKASMSVFHFSIFQYWHLVHTLHSKDVLPKDLVSFLNQTASQNLLESDGGSWRFRHRILQEYFAGHWAAVYGAAFSRGEEEEEKSPELTTQSND